MMDELEGERARFDERFSAAGYFYGKEPNAFLVSQAQLLQPGQKALVPGDGEGRNGVWLAGQGLDVTSFDPSSVGVEKIKQLAIEKGVTIKAEVGDLANWDWVPDAFDLVVLTYVHVDPEIRRVGHAGAWRTLKSGGRVILEGFSPRQHEMVKAGAKGGPKEMDRLFSKTMMREEFPGALFEILEDTDDVFEGESHSGRCAVLRMVARKP